MKNSDAASSVVTAILHMAGMTYETPKIIRIIAPDPVYHGSFTVLVPWGRGVLITMQKRPKGARESGRQSTGSLGGVAQVQNALNLLNYVLLMLL